MRPLLYCKGTERSENGVSLWLCVGVPLSGYLSREVKGWPNMGSGKKDFVFPLDAVVFL